MPEYLAPGVFVEETSYRAKSIQGVATSTTAFVGPARRGPLGMASDVITSFGEFERIYGGLKDLEIAEGTRVTNYLAHGVRSYFDNGGARLYVSRTFNPRRMGSSGAATLAGNSASADVGSDGDKAGTFRARHAGAGSNGYIIAYEKKSPAAKDGLKAAPAGSLAKTDDEKFYIKGATGDWKEVGAGADADPADISAGATLITLNLELRPGADSPDGAAEGGPVILENLGFGSGHPRALEVALPMKPTSRGAQLSQVYGFAIETGKTAADVHKALFTGAKDGAKAFSLSGGHDGNECVATDTDEEKISYKEALDALAEISDISIVAAPGHSAIEKTAYEGVQQELIGHAERMRYRVAILDTPKDKAPGDVRTDRGRLDSKYAAMYYPWVVVSNPSARPGNDTIDKELALPPSGFMAGVYARNDIQRGVWKAPANEVVRGALRFEREISKGQQETLNPEGINCLRTFFGRGNRVWGARTISSDPEWMYLNVRRYFIYVEHSIDRSTQWAVFEPNGPDLWSNITDTVSSFLFAEWRSGALLGATPEEAFFVRCDRSTMTQADLDNGRLICEIGIAAIKPAEFVIFRIGQKTADASA